MKLEHSLWSSQQQITGHGPKPDKSSHRPYVLFH